MTAPNHDRPTRGLTPRAWLALLAAFGLALLYAPRLVAAFTEAINWDEFALLHRVEQSLREGHLFGGGRPGLVNLILVPLVRDCVDAVTTAVRARVLWQFFTLSYLFGTFALVRNWFRFSGRPERGLLEGATAVALLAFLPAFVAWSVQVRTDQAALAAATWGATFLLSDRRTHALVAGTLFGISVLCTQKGVYVASLAGTLWISAVIARSHALPADQRRTEYTQRALQLVLVAISALAVIASYLVLAPTDAGFASERGISSSWADMRRTRDIVGYRAYVAAATQAWIHGILFLGLLAASIRAVMHRRWPDGHLLATCWMALLLGCLVALVHGSSWAYFIMTLGLFGAVGLGLVSGHLTRALRSQKRLIIGLSLLALILGSAETTWEMLHGSQADQREAINWIRSSGLGAYRGYQVDGALVCMADPDPIRPMSHKLNMGQLSSGEAAAFIDEFRAKQVAYLVDADRLDYFPSEVLDFWSAHYRWYFGPVWVAGFEVSGTRTSQPLDVIVNGLYRWTPLPPHGTAELSVAGKVITAGATVWLSPGYVNISTRPDGARGFLTLTLDSTPGPRAYEFMDRRQRERLGGAR